MMHKQTLRPALAFTVLALAACSSTPVPRASVTSNVCDDCDDCGRIVHVETVAAGNSKALGGIVGSVASKPLPGTYDYRIHVQLDNGQRTSVLRDELDGLEPGQRVRVSEGRLIPLP